MIGSMLRLPESIVHDLRRSGSRRPARLAGASPGWVAALVLAGVMCIAPGDPASAQPVPQVRVSVEEAALRTGPSARDEIAGLIERGTVLSVIGRVSDWYRVRVPSELGISAETGYLHESTLTATRAEGVDGAPERAVTLLVGIGQATPWLGIGAAYQITNRLDVIVGVGTVPGPLSGNTLGVAFGGRYFLQDDRSRPFLELTVTPIASEQLQSRFGRTTPDALYGLAPQVGYEHMWGNGITVLGSAGYGVAFESDFNGDNQTAFTFNLGLGYSF